MMEYDVYYFSPTGNCRAVAELLVHNQSGGRLIDLTLPEPRAAAPMPDKGKFFTLIFPVYAERIPDLLRDWLCGLPRLGGMACLIACYGSVTAGNALPDAVRLVTEQLGMKVIAGAELPGPHSFDCAKTGRDLRINSSWAEAELLLFFHAALRKAGQDGEEASFSRRLAMGAILPQDFLCKLGSPYPAVDMHKCTHCGVCKKVCPSGAVAGKHSLCVRCTACIRACPAGARSLTFRSGVPGLFLQRNMKQKKTPRYEL